MMEIAGGGATVELPLPSEALLESLPMGKAYIPCKDGWIMVDKDSEAAKQATRIIGWIQCTTALL